VIGYRVPGYAKKPRSERRAAPLELTQVRECLMKNVGCQFFRRRTPAHSPRYVGINAFEVEFIQLGKTARISLRRFDQCSFLVLVLRNLQD
jgi:hypothetical protein